MIFLVYIINVRCSKSLRNWIGSAILVTFTSSGVMIFFDIFCTEYVEHRSELFNCTYVVTNLLPGQKRVIKLRGKL